MSRCNKKQISVCQPCSLVEIGKFVGTGNTGPAAQGTSCALSHDGTTMAVGGPSDNPDPNTGSPGGAVWIFILSNGSWVQQAKLVASDSIGYAGQGSSCSMSDDGNTLVFGGPNDNSGQGALWVFTRSGTVWSEQTKIVVDGSTFLGNSCSMSDDGLTFCCGAPYDNSNNGAVFVFEFIGGNWVQTAKLIGTGNIGEASQGGSCSIACDGNTVAVGGFSDNSGIGATWIFTRSGTSWAQQGTKLVGRGGIGAASQGYSVALSFDGTVLAVGGPYDDTDPVTKLGVGAVWVFTLGCGSWKQQAPKLVGAGSIGDALQGFSIDISEDGQTLIEAGLTDNSGIGAVWMFQYSCGSWSQVSKLVGSGNVGAAHEGCSVALSADASTVIFGGSEDNANNGAVWVFSG